MPSKKKKTVKNPMGVALSFLAVILIMIGIPGGINALQAEIEAEQEPVLLYSLNLDDAINLIEDESGNLTYYGFSATGENYNMVYLAGPAATHDYYVFFENIDWSKITKVNITTESTTSHLYFAVAICGEYFANPFHLVREPNVKADYDIDFIDRIRYNQEPKIILKMGTPSLYDGEGGDYMIFSINFYGIEDPAIPLDLIPNYGALAGAFILSVMAVFATPWLNVSDVQNSLKKPVKKKKKNNGGKK